MEQENILGKEKIGKLILKFSKNISKIILQSIKFLNL